jgi:hypothetical protein
MSPFLPGSVNILCLLYDINHCYCDQPRFLKSLFEQRGILGRRQHLGQPLPSCYNCCLVPMKSFEGIDTVGDLKKPF